MAYCPQCGTELPRGDARFCLECGVALLEGEVAVPVAAEPTPEPVVHFQLQRRTMIRGGVAVVALVFVLASVAVAIWAASASADRREAEAAAAAALVTVPDVRGLTASQATMRIKDAGLLVGNISYDSKTEGALNAVVGEHPAPGSKVEASSAVALTVVGGEPVKVPYFVGLEGSGARAAAAAVGLNVLLVERDGAAKAGTVLSQDPASGELVQPGSSVTLMTAKGTQPQPQKSADGVYTPAKGTAERTAIMDAARIYLGYDGLFIVNELKVRSSRAFASVTPEDNRSWGAIGLYMMKNGNGWVVTTDSRTAAYQGSFVSDDDWLFNR